MIVEACVNAPVFWYERQDRQLCVGTSIGFDGENYLIRKLNGRKIKRPKVWPGRWSFHGPTML